MRRKGEERNRRERKKRSGKRVFEILYFFFPILGDPAFTEKGGETGVGVLLVYQEIKRWPGDMWIGRVDCLPLFLAFS